MGSCANGGGYYHYSYSVVRGCDRACFFSFASRHLRYHISLKASSLSTFMSPVVPRLPKHCCTECCSFKERCGVTVNRRFGKLLPVDHSVTSSFLTFSCPGTAINSYTSYSVDRSYLPCNMLVELLMRFSHINSLGISLYHDAQGVTKFRQ